MPALSASSLDQAVIWTRAAAMVAGYIPAAFLLRVLTFTDTTRPRLSLRTAAVS